MQLGLGNQLAINPVNSVPLGERPTLGISFDRSRYTNPLGYANQTAVGSSDFKLQSYAGPSPTFTRATAATFRGSNGLIQYAPENLFQRSEELNVSPWTRGGVLAFGSGSITNALTSPSGTLTAGFICENTSNTSHGIYQRCQQFIQSNTPVTISVFVGKSNNQKSRRYCYLVICLGQSDPLNDRYVINVDLLDGVVTSSAKGVNIFNNTNYIEDFGNFWRLSVTASCTTSGDLNFIVVGASNSATPTYDSYREPSYQGDGTSGIYIWGAQLERSSTARPYISTTSAARYGPRFEYDLNGEPLGLLMEEQSQNLLSYSEQFDNAYWYKNLANVSANTVLAPNGLTIADSIFETIDSGVHGVQKSVTVTSGLTYSYSAYVGAIGGRDGVVIRFGNGSTDSTPSTFIGSVTLVFSTGLVSTSGSVSSSVKNLGGGLFYISVQVVSTATSLHVSAWSYNGSSASFAGSTTKGFYIWGAQLEQKPFATSYIPTVAGAVTRSADTLSMPVGTWYNTDVGTIVFEGDRLATSTNNAQGYDSFFSFYSNLAAYNVLTHLGASDYEQFEAALSGFGSSAYTYIGSEIAPNTPIKFALTYDSPTSTFYAAINGFAPTTTSGLDPLEVPDTLRFGSIGGNSVMFGPLATSYFNGHIKSFSYTAKYWPDDVQALTT